ncbi:MAG: hypothetical protein GX453_00280 [Lactococcus chungangensis]|uniref:Uncharacterized protein n=1 Tax=Pseudolactococcus chungangensis TaxID=451457 RepID=A0A847J1P5_9LACT|nr:hypothetical protein [Lactococcus chungangensis]
MSEQKYYVRLKSPNKHIKIWWCGDRSEWLPYSLEPIYGEEFGYFGEREVIGWKVSKYVPSFTKTELAKIMDGALYKGHEMNQDCVFLGCEEWINPLIELVPVEDNK